MLELAAWRWNLSLPAAIRKLVSRGLDLAVSEAEIATYQAYHPDHRARVRALWEQARRCFHHSTTSQNLLEKLRLRCDATGDRWAPGPGQLLGSLAAFDVEQCFQPGACVRSDRPRSSSNRNSDRVFKGRGWDTVLALPFYDLPGRLSSLLFIGRQGRPDEDYVLRRVLKRRLLPEDREARYYLFDAGLHYHPQVLEAARRFHNTVIGLGDPLLALRLQLRHFGGSLLPLPLVAWLDRASSRKTIGRTREAWQIFRGQKIILWAPLLTAAAVRQILYSGAEVSTWGFTKTRNEGGLFEFLQHRTTEDVLRSVRKTARPWPEAISDCLGTLPESAVEEILFQLDFGGADVQKLREHCRGKTSQRIEDIVAGAVAKKTVVYGASRITEAPNGWLRLGRNGQSELICDGKLEIRRVIRHEESGDVYYDGVIHFQGEALPFCEPQAVVETKTFAWMRDLLLARGKGLLRFNPTLSTGAVLLATQFHRPRLVSATGRLGWQESKSRFVLPSFAIASNGRVEPDADISIPGEHPAGRLRPPDTLLPAELAGPAESAAASAYWASLAALLADILAPAYRQPPSGICLCGAGASRVGRAVATAAGCEQVRLVPQISESVLEREQAHAWPIFVETPAIAQQQKQLRLAWWTAASEAGRLAITEAELLAGAALCLRGGWTIICQPALVVLPQACAPTTSRLVPAYLRDLCARQMALATRNANSWFDSVLDDLAGFVGRGGGPEDVVRAARDIVLPDRSQGWPVALVELLRNFLQSRDLLLEVEGYESDKARPKLLRTGDGGVLIPRDALAQLCAKHRLPLPDPLRITDLLLDADALTGQSEQGWLVSERWWSTVYSLLDRENRLRIVG